MEKVEMFDEYLDEYYPAYEINGISFSASKVLFDCDPVAYRCWAADFEDLANGMEAIRSAS